MRAVRAARVAIALAIAPPWLLAGCDHDHAAGMTLAVLKKTPSGCYGAIGAPADPVFGLPACEAADPVVVPGVDQLLFAIDYGSDVEISGGAPLAAPTVVVAFDGTPAMAPVALDPRRGTGRIWYLAHYAVPAIAAGEMVVTAQAASDLRAASPALPLALPAALVRVQQCGAGPACQLAGTGATVTVEVAVPSRTAQTVTLRTRLDGISNPSAPAVMTAPAGDPPLASATLPLEIPWVDQARQWEIEADWFGAPGRTVISLRPPSIELAIDECAGDPASCAATAGVGSLHAQIAIPGDAPQAATLRSFVGGALVLEQPVTTAVVADHGTRASAALAVPFATEGTTWRIDLVWRSLTTSAPPIALHAPVVTSAIGCGTPCTVAAGTAVELAIAAPKAIQAATASFTASIPGAPPSTSTLASSTVDESTATRVWRTALTAPATGPWKIDASVAGYPATTINADIVP